MKNICNSKRITALNLSSDKVAILNSIEFTKQTKGTLLMLIEKYHVHNIDYIWLYHNWEKIIKLGRDSSSKNSYITRYGEKKGFEFWELKTSKCTQTKDKFIAKYGEEEAVNRLSKRGASLQNYLARYGDEGHARWAEYCHKRANTYTQKKESGHKYPSTGRAHYIELYGQEEGNRKFQEKMDSAAFKNSLAGYIEKYGVDEGNARCSEVKDNNSLDKLISIHGEGEGFKKHKEICDKIGYAQTLPGYMDRHGIELGTQLYQEKCQKAGYANTLDYYLSRYGEDGRQLFQDRYENHIAILNKNKRFSKWSQDVCVELKQLGLDLYYFGENELRLKCKGFENLNLWVKPDLFYNGKIIEFNGDCWHANPNIYSANDRPNPLDSSILASDIWIRDAAKIKFYESNGYTVLTVWQSDYLNNKQEVIARCLKFLTM